MCSYEAMEPNLSFTPEPKTLKPIAATAYPTSPHDTKRLNLREKRSSTATEAVRNRNGARDPEVKVPMTVKNNDVSATTFHFFETALVINKATAIKPAKNRYAPY